MARLVVKIKYLKPTASRKAGRYAKYIGTREGVQKIDDSTKHQPATQKQQRFIDKMIREYPECKDMIEYKDYLSKSTKGTASEFINRAMEEYYESTLDQKTYADYIATRPGSERIGKHGLFTDDIGEVDLQDVSKELNAFDGIVWTAIVSLRREDAEKLGFDRGERWRNLVRMHREDIAKAFHIRSGDFQWYAAFHDESYHPHIHMIVYDKTKGGHISKQGIEEIKRMFAHDIFRDEMFLVQNEKTNIRDELRRVGRYQVEQLISKLNAGSRSNLLNGLILDLSKRLKNHQGRKYYSYLKTADKKVVDSIVDEIGKIPEVSQLYDLWYEKQEGLVSFYNSKPAPRVPLSMNPSFKTIRNEVIKAASEVEVTEFVGDEDLVGINVDVDRVESAITDFREKKNRRREIESSYLASTVARLLSNVVGIFRDEFKDDQGEQKVDRKLRRQISEKEQAHGIKHG